MKLNRVAVETDSSTIRLVGEVVRAEAEHRTQVYFQFPIEYRDFVDESAAPFLIAMLVPAMIAGEPLESAVPASPELTFSLRRVHGLMHFWYPELHQVAIRVPEMLLAPTPLRNRAASFFSGGVDSFYTLLRYHRGERLPVPLTHVVMMRGVETRLEGIVGVGDSENSAAEAAAAVGVRAIFGETNIRSVFRAHWENYYFGSGLAATAYALSRGFDYSCIPSSLNYRNVIPHGSSPLLDELFSTPQLRIVHDGADARRPDKVARIVEWAPELVLSKLRVCTRNKGGDSNCGRCYKCVRTAISLDVIGLFEGATAFQDKSRTRWPKAVAADHQELVEENLAFARERAAPPELVALLARAVQHHRRRAVLQSMVRSSPRLSRWSMRAKALLRPNT